MKVIITAMVFVITMFFTVKAQLPVSKTGTAGIGDLMGHFKNAIQPSAFNDQWESNKTSFLGNVGKTTDAGGVGKIIGSLAGFLKPDMFKQGFNVQSLISSAGTVKKMVQAASLLKNLEGGLKPEAFASGWTQKRTGWLNALNLIK